MEETNARFRLDNARITRIKSLPKVAFVTCMCQAGKYPSFFDLTVFDGSLGRWVEGDAVNVSGELSMRKPKEGSRDWTVQLIARKMEKGDDAKAPRPRASSDRREQNTEAPPADYGDVDF